jgi:hypothetical protein
MKFLVPPIALLLLGTPIIHAQAPAVSSDFAVIRKVREKVIGKWTNFSGDVMTFTTSGVFTLGSADPKMPKEIGGTFVISEDLHLKVTFNGKSISSEFSVDSDLLRIKNANGTFAEYQRWDHKGIADLTLRELKVLDGALDQWAIEFNKREGEKPTVEELRKYLKKAWRLYFAVGDPAGPKDLLGNPFGVLAVSRLKVNPETAKTLSDVAPKSHWAGFID